MIVTLDLPEVWRVIKDLLQKGWQVWATYDSVDGYTIHATKDNRRWAIQDIEQEYIPIGEAHLIQPQIVSGIYPTKRKTGETE